jgi:hypothetical protein
LEPAEDLNWRETLEVPGAPAGYGGIEVGVEIVDPSQCDAVGCPRTEVRASKTVIFR